MSLRRLGPYELIRLIGRGGMGAVYEGVDELTGEHVAVKALTKARSLDESFCRRFEAEINTLVPLDHPNIVHILGHGRDQGHFFLVMELVRGKSLFEYQTERKTLPWAEVVGYVQDLCKGLKHAHDRGFIHRDLKLGNLLLDENGTLKLTDFGIARYGGVTNEQFREAITAPGGVVGTLDYMAPETLFGQPATVRSDLYSVGCVMYSLLAGRTPFVFKSVGEAMETFRSGKVTRLGLLVPGLPPELEKIVMRLLEFEPEKRPGSAQALSKRLNEFLEERGHGGKSQETTEEVPDDFEIDSDLLHTQKTMMSDEPGTVEGEDDAGSAERDVPTSRSVARSAPSLAGRSLPTLAEPGSSARRPQREDYFATVSEDQRRGNEEWQEPELREGPIWPIVAGLGIVLVALLSGVYFLALRSPTADDVYAEIQRTVEEGGVLLDAEPMIEQFLQRFPDDARVEEVAAMRRQIEADRLPRQLERQAHWQGPAALTDAERMLLDALRLADTRPGQAVDRLEAIVILFRDSAEERDARCALAAETELESLRLLVQMRTEDRVREISELLAGARSAPASDRAAWADRLTALTTLYGDDPLCASALQGVRAWLDAQTVPSGNAGSTGDAGAAVPSGHEAADARSEGDPAAPSGSKDEDAVGG